MYRVLYSGHAVLTTDDQTGSDSVALLWAMDAKSPPSACKPFDSILVLRKVGSHTWVHLDLTLVRRNGLSLELPSLELPSSSRYTLYMMYDLLAHVVTLLQRQLLAFAEAIEGAWCMCTHVFKLWRAYSLQLPASKK